MVGMAELQALITCRHVWSDEEPVKARLDDKGVLATVPRFEGQQLEEADLLRILGEYDGILAGDDHLTRVVLEAAPRLKVISKWGIGIDAIDLDAAKELGVEVFNTPGVFGEELADYAMGYIHMLARRQHEMNAAVKEGVWQQVRGVSLAGKTLGIVGLGSSGVALARRAIAASMRVVFFDVDEERSVAGCERVDLDQLWSDSDIVSLHLPATLQTRNLIDASSIEQMKDGAWLINTSRGALVDETALYDALQSGKLGGAALDVFQIEPVAAGSPLLSLDNVIVGSHNGSNTQEAVERTTWLAVDNLLRGFGLDVSP